MGGSATKYRGFISYSHEDRQLAIWLHRKLETYRLPRRIAGDDARSLGKFFVDREGLSAAEDLTQSLKDALAESETLIVICSPQAAKSQWVAKEIDTFRELNPQGQALTVIARGDPREIDVPNSPFPRPVLADGREPLAADMRASGAERRLGFLKLVAALIGTDPGELLQRDAIRRQQRVTLVTVAASVIAIAMTSLAIVAFNAEQEAEARQAQAEGLVDFMLTDLRDRLEPIGRLDVLDGVATEVLQYYPEKEDASLGCVSAGNLVRALHLATDLKWQSAGSAVEAAALVERALARSQQSIEACANDPQSALDHGTSTFYKTGEPLGRGDRDQFLKLTEQQDKMIEAFCLAKPGDTCTINRAFVQVSFGMANAFFQTGQNFDKAEDHYLAAVELYEATDKFANNNYQIRDYHANAHGWLADARFNAGDFDGAERYRDTEQRLYREMLALRIPELKDTEGRLRRRILGSNLGRMRALIGAGREAEVVLLKGLVLPEATSLIQFDPSNLEWKDAYVRLLVIGAIAEFRIGLQEDACRSWNLAIEFTRDNDLNPRSASQVTESLVFKSIEFCS